MRAEKLFETLNDINENDIVEASTYKKRKPSPIRLLIPLACAAAVFAIVLCLPLFKDRGSGSTSGVLCVMAACPDPVAENMNAAEFMMGDAHWEWWSAYREGIKDNYELNNRLKTYYSSVMGKLLAYDENTVCSPLNTYLAFSMLAEVSDGNTRQQILDMLGVADIETLRKNVSDLYMGNYVDTPVLKSIPANSIWLNNETAYNDETLNLLANQYYASSFRGAPGSEELNEALRGWMDKGTGGLLSEYTKEMATSPDLIMELVSTIYYKAMWQTAFQADSTDKAVFHGTNGDTDVDMMHMTTSMSVYKNESFTALGLGLSDSGGMFFFLPNESKELDDLLSDDAIFDAISYENVEDNWTYSLVNLSIPRFSVSCKSDVIDMLKELGVTDAMNATLADFSPLTDQSGIFLNKAEHAAMVEIDEEGVTGAAYTDMELCGAGLPEDEIDFTADRPFMFIITGGDGSILFAGTIKNID